MPCKLAQAGVFILGSETKFNVHIILDHTKCFHCNGGLCNWEPGDDPWVEHARWYHDCDFLRFNKDETFIETCVEKQLSKKKLELDIPEQLSSFECPGSLLIQVDEAMKSNIVKQLLETNVFAPYIIRAAIVRQIKETGYAFNTVDELCFAVSYLKNEMERDPIKMNKCHPTDLNIQSVQLRMPMVASNSQNSTIECGETSLKSSTVSEEKGTEEATIPIKGTEEATIPIKGTEEATISKDHCLCKICMDQEVRVVFLPCGHLLTCTECASALKSCPMCRKDIQATVRAYLP
ncbi:death-associated inhibitor of apoptosis 2 [Caerostris extrusa]|uniref:Death-associated inhibitor of apoptosis 2 n=1 Tax=Caerostris extrusa TaxID=172846 RepID=A0AAV4S9H7_CAEEX|nr:death-associated inhibitor of apoptosis 2 [Caerostris extrusa]